MNWTWWVEVELELNWDLREDGIFWFGACLIASLLQTSLFICGSARKSKHKPLFKFTWNLPFLWKFPQPMKFAFSEVSATHEICLLGSFSNSFHFATFCHILQRYCNFCSDIFNFCNVIATFLILQFYLLHLLCKSFTMQFITWF